MIQEEEEYRRKVMEILNVRIEERLIHGQIATVWNQFLKPNRIIIIDKEAAGSDMQKKLLKLACPQGVKLSIFAPQRAVERLQENPYGDEKVFILFKNPSNLKEFVDLGYTINKVNVGNMGGKQGAVEVKKAVCVTHEEAEIFRELNRKGIAFEAKMVPTDSEVDFLKLIKNV